MVMPAKFIFTNPERLSCYPEGSFGMVNFTYENYLSLFVGGEFGITGRAAICYNGAYSSICDVHWDKHDADILCRYSLGSSIYGKQIYYS